VGDLVIPWYSSAARDIRSVTRALRTAARHPSSEQRSIEDAPTDYRKQGGGAHEPIEAAELPRLDECQLCVQYCVGHGVRSSACRLTWTEADSDRPHLQFSLSINPAYKSGHME